MKVVEGRLVSTHAVNYGSSVKAFGVNYFDVFTRMLESDVYTDYEAGFAELSSFNVAFARFPLGFWPLECSMYVTDKPLFFSKLTAIFDSAESHGIGLIPSLFWARGTVPDIVGDTVNQWGNVNSLTHGYMRDFVDDFFSYLGGHNALWAIEFGNEYNLYLDLPNSNLFRPGINLGKGTPATRTELDDLTLKDAQVALRGFANQVRLHDADIPISSGNTIQREYSFHNAKYGTWAADSVSHVRAMSKYQETPGINLSSVHLYPTHKQRFAPIIDGAVAYSSLIDLCSLAPTSSSKAVFLGEFGVDNFFGTELEVAAEFDSMITDIYSSDIALPCLWVYRFSFQDADWNVTGTNARSYQLQKLQEYNALLASSGSLALF